MSDSCPVLDEEEPLYDSVWLAEMREQAAGMICEEPDAGYEVPDAFDEDEYPVYGPPAPVGPYECYAEDAGVGYSEMGPVGEPASGEANLSGPYDHYVEPGDAGPFNPYTTRDADGDFSGYSWHGRLYGSDEDDDVQGKLLEVDADVGHYINEEGKEEYGVHAGGSTVEVGTKLVDSEYFDVGIQFGGPDANGGITHNEDQTEVSGQASEASVELELAKQNTGSDVSATYGASMGPGAAARLHHGDEDGDGRNEYGIGVDFNWWSADVKAEDPLRWSGGIFTGIPVEIAEAVSGRDLNITDWLFGD